MKNKIDTPAQTRKKPLLKNEVKPDQILKEGNRILVIPALNDPIRAFRGRLQGSTASLLLDRRKERK